MRFLYANARNVYPHDRHLIDGLRENGHTVVELEENGPGPSKYLRLFKRLRQDKTSYDAVFAGFPSPIFAIVARLARKEKVIFNATSSQYEANIVSRGVFPFSPAALKWWLIDLLSFHMSSQVLLESDAQRAYIHKLFFVPKRKLVRAWSGLNEKDFFYEPGIGKLSRFTVLFRGRFLGESGIETVIKAAKSLEQSGVSFLVIGHGFLHREVGRLMAELHPANLEMITTSLPIAELRRKMQECHISLGQMADHPRLDRTLPMKLFESLAMRLPYLTGRNKGALELLKEDETCLCSKPGDAEDLAEKILFLKGRPEILERVASNGYELYRHSLTSKILAQEVVEACFPHP